MKFTLQFLESIEILLKFVITILCAALLSFNRRHSSKTDFSKILILTGFATCFIVLLWQQLGLWEFGKLSIMFFSSLVVGLGILSSTILILYRVNEENLHLVISIWIAGGIGMAVGLSLYFTAIVATIVSFLLLFIIDKSETKNKINS